MSCAPMSKRVLCVAQLQLTLLRTLLDPNPGPEVCKRSPIPPMHLPIYALRTCLAAVN
jgi:hypothetical protein